jgi:hypothetical protein
LRFALSFNGYRRMSGKIRTVAMHGIRCLLLIATASLAACRTVPVAEPAQPATPAPPIIATRGEFLVEAGALDTWNAVGQIAVRTPGVTYEGRAQMLGLYALRYRGEPLMVLTRPLLASQTSGRLTTRVTATTAAGKLVDSNAAAELLALLQRELPAEIESVRKRQAAEKAKARKRKSR